MNDFAKKLKKEALIRGLDSRTKDRTGPAAHLGGVQRLARAFAIRVGAPNYDSIVGNSHKLNIRFTKPALHGINEIEIYKDNSTEFSVYFYQKPTFSQKKTMVAQAEGIPIDGPRRTKNLLEVIEEVTGIEI